MLKERKAYSSRLLQIIQSKSNETEGPRPACDQLQGQAQFQVTQV